MIEIKGLDEITRRMAQFPREMDAVNETTMQASLTVIHESIPAYPTVDNPTRTGTLGRTLGSGMQGGNMGTPDIYEVKKLGGGVEGRFGTKLEYADYVIGESQTWFHYRWFLLKNIAKEAEGRIIKLWDTAAEKMAKFLDGKGL